MAALKDRVQSLLGREKIFILNVSDDLHAKIYSFSNGKVIIGSANLTWPAMTTNIETICELTKADATSFQSFLSKFRSRFTPVSIDVFAAYVDAISKPSDVPIEEDQEMNAAIDIAEETLRKSLTLVARKAPIVPHLGIENFKDYCCKEKSSVSSVIIERIGGKDQLQGHVKHCYYGAIRFFSEFPKFVSEIADTPRDSLYDFTNQDIRTKWRDFLHNHADEIDEKQNFSFHTLRVYIPEKLGGICSGGGGASGTLKRVLPLVARMLQKSGKKK
jgi:hypothetical protein